MAELVKFIKVLALPETLEPNAFYFVENGEYAESYLTNSTGVARMIGNSGMINELAEEFYAQTSNIKIVADIAARDALDPSVNKLVLVLDASSDASVEAGAATYIYNFDEASFVKIAEHESMDVTLEWADIVGGPTSTPTQIDAAVADSHTHANQTELDKIGEDVDGRMTYDGQVVGTFWDETNW